VCIMKCVCLGENARAFVCDCTQIHTKTCKQIHANICTNAFESASTEIFMELLRYAKSQQDRQSGQDAHLTQLALHVGARALKHLC
jgi:hypothetical protein